jgi:hypothetical protein
MEKEVIILGLDEKQNRQLSVLLEESGYHFTVFQDLSKLKSSIKGRDDLAVILDLDSVPLDNRIIRDLALKNPGIFLIGVSKERFHPELKDAICYHLYACINIGSDQYQLQDELLYWLKTICVNEINESYLENTVTDLRYSKHN